MGQRVTTGNRDANPNALTVVERQKCAHCHQDLGALPGRGSGPHSGSLCGGFGDGGLPFCPLVSGH